MKYLRTFKTKAEYEAAKASLPSPNVANVSEDASLQIDDKEYVNKAVEEVKKNIAEFDPETMQFLPKKNITKVIEGDAIYKVLPNVTSMSSCFSGCSFLTSISLPALPNVTNIGSCFSGCKSLKSISLPALPNVTNMGSCFQNCSSLTSISLPALPNVTYMGPCFQNCSSLTSISLPELPKVTNMGGCFYSCFSLETLTIGALNTALSNLSSCGLSTCTKLTVDSLLNVFNALPQRTGTNRLTIGTTNLNKLTDEQKQIATSKGWTLN